MNKSKPEGVNANVATTTKPSGMGNTIATNVGKGGPGVGRTIHPSGSQSPTPAPSPVVLGEWGLDAKKG